MNIWVICTGAPDALPKRCTGAAFEAAMAAAADGAVPPYTGKPLQGAGRPLYAAPGHAARETAKALYPDADIQVEPLLSPIPQRAFRDGEQSRPLWLWQAMARLQRKTGNPRQPESQKQAEQRLDTLIDRLEETGKDCILVADTELAALLLDRLRLRSCSFARSGVFRLQPYERILVTARDTHCGGCGHNCFLANPGCGIGRDQAARLKQGYKA